MTEKLVQVKILFLPSIFLNRRQIKFVLKKLLSNIWLKELKLLFTAFSKEILTNSWPDKKEVFLIFGENGPWN